MNHKTAQFLMGTAFSAMGFATMALPVTITEMAFSRDFLGKEVRVPFLGSFINTFPIDGIYAAMNLPFIFYVQVIIYIILPISDSLIYLFLLYKNSHIFPPFYTGCNATTQAGHAVLRVASLSLWSAHSYQRLLRQDLSLLWIRHGSILRIWLLFLEKGCFDGFRSYRRWAGQRGVFCMLLPRIQKSERYLVW